MAYLYLSAFFLLQINPITPTKYLPVLNPSFTADYSMMGSAVGVPSNLESLVSNSHIIVVGKYIGILQHRHTPHNSNSYYQSTIYHFQVEQYIKGSGKNDIKIYQEGGPLNWINPLRNKSGKGYKVNGDPFPLIGSRYILLLNNPSNKNLKMSEHGYREAEWNGIRGISQYADEFNYSFPTRSKFIIKNNIVFPGQIIDDPNASLTLQPLGSGKAMQLTGISEQQAIENIRVAVKATSIDSINSRYKFVKPTIGTIGAHLAVERC